jgi:hypothetical protein
VAMVRVCAPKLTLLRVMQVETSRAFTEGFIAHSFSAPGAAEGQLLFFCLPDEGKNVR